MNKWFCTGGVVVFSCLLLWGCVNIPNKIEAHITVDIRHHIEQQAESTLDFIEGKSTTLPAAAADDAGGEADKASLLERAINLLDPMPVAYAADLKNASPEVTRIATSLRNRNEQIQAIKRKGYVGESNRGKLELRNSDKIPNADERNEVQRLVAAENADRKALYQEIAKLNADKKVSVSTVEGIYAMERLRRAKPGDIFQLPIGAEFEAFMRTDVGKRLGMEAAPGAWVAVK